MSTVNTWRVWIAMGCLLGSVGCSGNSESTKGEVAVQQFAACKAEFQITEPVAGRPWTPNAIKLVSKALSPGVFVVYDEGAPNLGPQGIPLATSAGFVIGEDGVVLIETMINRQLFCQLIDLVRAETDKPLLYAINTSHHGDHSYGNAFLPEGVQVVQHRGTVDFITDPEAFAGDVAFMEANFGDDQGIDEVTAVRADVIVEDSGWSVDIGGRTVEALYLGFGQTHGDLFVYVPEANVVWTGNPIVARAPALPWLLDGHAKEVRETLIGLRDRFPGATIIPGHDEPRVVSDLDFAIEYLGVMIDEVQSAVDGAKTLEETVASVTMERFQGYALWDWVHSVVNVPATYNELSK
ncbi:MAG: MBL fold metallo-hydrolase [Bradymonadia bacterium]